MNNLKAGFSRVDITPPLGISLDGTFEERRNIEVLDPLCATCLAVSDGENEAVLVSTDLLYLPEPLLSILTNAVVNKTGLKKEQIFLHGTHTHNGPAVSKCDMDMYSDDNDSSDSSKRTVELIDEYFKFLSHRVADVCQQALWDMKPAKMGWTVGKAPNVAFIRRFRMKDGSIVTNPGINNPDILEPIGKIDDRVNILKFKRGDGDTITLVNFGNHPCVVNGPRVSADWPGYMYRFVEQAIPETKCIFFNGFQGDVNHVNVFPSETDRYLNYDPDDKYKEVRRSFAEYMGRAMAGTVMQEYDKVKYVDVKTINYAQKVTSVPNHHGTDDEIDESRKILDLWEKIGDTEMRKLYPEMTFETILGKASRVIRMLNFPKTTDVQVSVIAIGPVAMVGFPGEPFSGGSFLLKDTSDWEMVLPCCCVNGAQGYFPMAEDYKEESYEIVDAFFAAGSLEQMVDTAKQIMHEFKKG